MNNKLVTISNNEKALKQFFGLIERNEVKIVMEATGRYHRLTHQVLDLLGFTENLNFNF